MDSDWKNKLYFGDNLPILRDHVDDESVDLIYLDPPFNSKATYNVLFREANGTESPAQITAFDDFWRWDMEAERAYDEVVTGGHGKVSELLDALRRFLGSNDMMAYLTMMAIRLIELRRVLKPTGSIYLHCDPTASHYLKLVLDAVFGARNFRSEIVWRRSLTHGGATKYNAVHDSIMLYSKTSRGTWNSVYEAHDPSYMESHYSQADEDGRRYQLIVAHGAGEGPGRRFGDKLLHPPRGRHWAWNQETIDRLMGESRIVFTRTGMPRLKVYLDESPGKPVTDVWIDIYPINSQAAERLGYPTQKPEALLERIISVSSNEGDLVLDPFCGCGTTVVVAERLHRRWIGIDITHLAVALMKSRLRDAFGEDLSAYQVLGEPEDLSSARALAQENRHQFQYWALGLVDARPAGKPKKGADKGIDGVILFFDDDSGQARRVIISVKSGGVSVGDVRDLNGVMEREKAAVGALITLEKPTRPMREEAAAAGLYEPPTLLEKVPRLQILTIEELLAGKKLEYPAVAPATFKRAARQIKAKRAKKPHTEE